MFLDGKFDGYAGVLQQLGTDPRTLYHEKDAFELEGSFFEFQPAINGVQRATVSQEMQETSALKLLENPLAANYCAMICSYPTDVRAKLFGAELLKRCWEEGRSHPNPDIRKRRPHWITLYNSYLDYEALRKRNPTALFISNITDDTTPQKMERLRDVLELFSGIPRVVMCGSSIDPVTLAATRLRYAVTHPLMFKGKTVVVSILDGL